VAARANPIGRQRLLDHKGRRLAEIDLDRLRDGVGGRVAIERAALHEALLEATDDLPVRLGTSVTGLEAGW
jgi:2-polyprenyl-6-methoxyphenol hydroxylase-like FAD-dependent oxidoreductase